MWGLGCWFGKSLVSQPCLWKHNKNQSIDLAVCGQWVSQLFSESTATLFGFVSFTCEAIIVDLLTWGSFFHLSGLMQQLLCRCQGKVHNLGLRGLKTYKCPQVSPLIHKIEHKAGENYIRAIIYCYLLSSKCLKSIKIIHWISNFFTDVVFTQKGKFTVQLPKVRTSWVWY